MRLGRWASLLAMGWLLGTSGVGYASEARFDWFAYQGSDPADARTLTASEYRNPVIAGFYPDPSVTRMGDDDDLVNSSVGWPPGLPILHSRNLANWPPISNAIARGFVGVMVGPYAEAGRQR